jgi:hypothetical protein
MEAYKLTVSENKEFKKIHLDRRRRKEEENGGSYVLRSFMFLLLPYNDYSAR